MAEQPIMHFHIQGDNHVYPTAAVVNNYFGQAVCESAMRMNSAPVNNVEESVEDMDELRAILHDKESYDEVVQWAATCKKPKDIRDRILMPLRRKGINDMSIELIKALIPHLTNYAGSKNPLTIQKQLY